MKSSFVDTLDDTTIVAQGFRGNDEQGINPYVFLGIQDGDGWEEGTIALTPEAAHILSEEIRKHAEFAATPRTEEEK